MKVSVQELSPIERKLSIEVDPSRIAEELTRAYSALGRQVKVPGFRTGKIPRRILEQRYRADVERDVAQKVVERAYRDAIQEHKVDAVSNPRITGAPQVTIGSPLSFEATVQVKPVVDPKQYKELPLKKREVVVPDSEVMEQLERMQERLARLEPVEDRDLTELGDYAQVDYVATIDGREFPGSKAENVTVEVAAGEVVEAKFAALAGTKVSETKGFDYAFPPDYGLDEVKGKVAHFEVKVRELKRSVTPPIDDDFAKEMSGQAEITTLDAFKAKIRADLEKGTARKNDTEARDELIEALAERNPFEVPEAMVDRTVNFMLEGALRNVQRSGVDLRTLNLDFKKLQTEMRPKALSEVKGSLLFEAISAKEKIEVSAEEVEKKMERLAEESGQPISQIKRVYKADDAKRSLQFQLREEKTIEFLKAHAKYS